MPSRAILSLTAAVGVVGANSLVLSPISDAVARDLAAPSAASVMTAAAILGLGTALSALLFAPRIDRIGAGHAMVIAMLVFAFGCAATAVAGNRIILSALQGIAGIGAGLALPAAYALAAELAPKGQENRTVGTVLTGWTISLVAGVSLSAFLTDLLHWRAVYGGLAILGLMLALGLSRLDLPNRRADRVTSPLTALKVPGITRALLVAISFMIAFYGFYSFIGAHVTGVLGRSVSAAGLIPLTYGIGFGLAVLADPLIDRMGPRRMALPVFTAICVIYAVMNWAVSNFWALAALALVWGLANHLGLTLIVARMVALDPGERGAIMGLNSCVTYLCVTGGALLFQPIYQGFSLSACALFAVAALMVAVLDAMVLRRGAVRTDPSGA